MKCFRADSVRMIMAIVREPASMVSKDGVLVGTTREEQSLACQTIIWIANSGGRSAGPLGRACRIFVSRMTMRV